MKILTKEEEAAHDRAVYTRGTIGLVYGTALGAAGVWAASRRFPMFRQLTIPFRAFLIGSAGTFIGIIEADRGSRSFDIAHNPEKQRLIAEEEQQRKLFEQNKTTLERAKEWGSKNRYGIVFGSWVASMGAAFAIVSRDRYLSGAQKLVQARVYAQGLTLAVLLASFALEANDANKGQGRWETIKVLDPNDPTHSHLIEKRIHHERYAGEDQWREMIEAEEEKMKARQQAVRAQEEKDAKEGKIPAKAA